MSNVGVVDSAETASSPEDVDVPKAADSSAPVDSSVPVDSAEAVDSASDCAESATAEDGHAPFKRRRRQPPASPPEVRELARRAFAARRSGACVCVCVDAPFAAAAAAVHRFYVSGPHSVPIPALLNAADMETVLLDQLRQWCAQFQRQRRALNNTPEEMVWLAAMHCRVEQEIN